MLLVKVLNFTCLMRVLWCSRSTRFFALSRMLCSYASTQPTERSKILEDSQELEDAFLKAALNGDSEAPVNPEGEVDFHYTCFVKSGTSGHLYGLSGDQSGPVVVDALQPDEDIV